LKTQYKKISHKMTDQQHGPNGSTVTWHE